MLLNTLAAVNATPQRPTATQDEHTISLHWLFILDKPNPRRLNDYHTRTIRVPRSLFNGPSQDCRDLFVTNLLSEFLFDAEKHSIVLWKPIKPLLLTDMNPCQEWTEKINEINDIFQPIQLARSLAAELDLDLARQTEDLHLSVAVTAEGFYQPKPVNVRKRTLVDSESCETIPKCWASKRLKRALPSIDELRGALREPLTDLEKVPITEAMFTQLISVFEPDHCTADDVGSLFKIGDYDPTSIHFIWSTIVEPPPPSGTEYSFVSFWDDNIRKLIKFILPDGVTIRNSNQGTETGKLRPDFGFLLEKMCIFRGEEKPPDKRENPKEELRDKFNWDYDSAPYVLGYYCNGTEMTLVAITAPDPQGSLPQIHDLVSVDLRWRKHRIANACYLINLAYMLPRLSELVRSPVDEFQEMQRKDSTIETTNTIIIKTYTCSDAHAKIVHLDGVYALLTTHKIPNTDTLLFSRGNSAYLSPRGLAAHPKTEKELRECLACILESLIAIHQVPMYHCDIRWENIIRKMDDPSKWFLIDWEDTAVPPTKAKPLFAGTTHSPSIVMVMGLMLTSGLLGT